MLVTRIGDCPNKRPWRGEILLYCVILSGKESWQKKRRRCASMNCLTQKHRLPHYTTWVKFTFCLRSVLIWYKKFKLKVCVWSFVFIGRCLWMKLEVHIMAYSHTRRRIRVRIPIRRDSLWIDVLLPIRNIHTLHTEGDRSPSLNGYCSYFRDRTPTSDRDPNQSRCVWMRHYSDDAIDPWVARGALIDNYYDLFTYTETGTGTDPCSGGYPYGCSCTMQKVHTGPKQGQIPIPNWPLYPFLGQGPVPRRGLRVCQWAITCTSSVN